MTQVDVADFLETFFGPGNDLALSVDWRQIPAFRSSFLPFVEDLEAGNRNPVLLPREAAGASLVYAWAWSPAQGRRLAEALRAFIGPTWSDFNGIAQKPRAGDPVEAALQALGDGIFFRFRIDAARRHEAWRAANLLREVWAATPARLVENQPPVGRLLRDFDMALAAHDQQLSAAVLEEIGRSGQLQPTNVAFLKIRRLRTFGDYQVLLRMPELHEVIDLRLPMAVRDTLLVAAQAVHLAQSKEANDPDGAARAAQEHLHHLRRLSDDVRVPPSEEAVDALLALLAADGDSARSRQLHDHLQDSATSWQRSLLARITPDERAPEGDAAGRVRAALTSGRPGEAWLETHAIEDATARLQLQVQCALTLQDAQVTQEVQAALQASTDAVQQAVLTPPWFARVWDEQVAQVVGGGTKSAGVRPPRDWGDLLSSLLTDDIDDPVQVLDDYASAWPPPGNQDRDLDQLLSRFDPSSTATYDNLTLIVPRLLEAVSDEQPAPRTAATCVTVLALSEDLTPAAVRALLEALRLSVVSAPADYGDILAVVQSVLPRTISVQTADWFLDAVDHLLAAPAPQETARSAFCVEVLTRLRGVLRRLSSPQRHLAQQLSNDLRLELEWEPTDASAVSGEIGPDLTGTVLLYSLRSSVLSRVKATLETLSGALTVHVSEEHDGSPRLRAQVQASDVLVVATRRAPHAATGAIERWRRASSVLVYAPGAGSASMLSSALAALTNR